MKTYSVAFLSYVLHLPESWFADKLGLVSSDVELVISDENKLQADKFIDWAKSKMTGVGASVFLKPRLSKIQRAIRDDKVTNDFILASIKYFQMFSSDFEAEMVKKMMC